MESINALINDYKSYFPSELSIDSTQEKIDDLNACFRAKGSPYYAPGGDFSTRANQFVETHIDLYRHDNCRPSLPLLAAYLAKKLGIDESSPEYKALLLVAFRAEMGQSDPPPAYHNPHHFADVAVMTAIYAQNTPSFDAHDKALALIAAFGHDIDHVGSSNPPDNPVFNEEKSYIAMQPLLAAAGISAQDQNKIHVILLTTSINGPLATLKSIATKKETDLSKFPELKPLVTNKKLTEMAAVVTDADIYAGSGAGLTASVLLSDLLTQETQASGGTMNFNGDGARLYFLENIIGKEGYLSQAARNLSNLSFIKLLEETRQNLKAAKASNGAVLPPSKKYVNK